MKKSSNEADYEPLRVWALCPSSVRPPGIAQFLRGGMLIWFQTVQPLPVAPSDEICVTQTTLADSTPLSMLMAAMIAEVFP